MRTQTVISIRLYSLISCFCLFFSVGISQELTVNNLATETFRPGRTGKIVEIDISFAPNAIPIPTTVELIDGYVIIEGDIVLGTEEEILNGRGAILNYAPSVWPNSTIPYTIQAGYPDVNMLYYAINHINSNSNLCLVPRTSETNYVEFVISAGCSSYIGMVGGKQNINVATGCGVGATIHEILHAAGHWHEQSRADRDTYVTINIGNVTSGFEHNFDKYSFGADAGAYDYGSIMHYSPTAFSTNGLNTIDINVPPGTSSTNTGQRAGMSAGDISAVNQVYTTNPSCSNVTLPANLTVTSLGTLDVTNGIVTVSNLIVENNGSAAIGASQAILFYAAAIGSNLIFNTISIPALAAGATHTVNTSNDLSGLANDTYRIVFQLNWTNAVTEGTTGDNQYIWNAPVLVLPLPVTCPSISSQPTANTTICQGAAVTLSVGITGGTSPTYQWQSSSTSASGFSNIGSATNANYMPSTTSVGTIYYRVIISDSGCSDLTSNEAIVVVNADPSITTQPVASTNVCVGSSLTLNVVTTGGINRSYQWQSSSTSGSGFSDIGSATNASYVAPTGSTGTIYYRVIISDSGSGCDAITSNEAVVTINADPSISTQPVANTNLCVGSSLTLNVVTAGGINISYQWQSSSTSGSGFSDIGSATNASYIAPTGSTGTTYYRVVISDSGTGCDAITSNEAVVIINAVPSITTQPMSNTDAGIGETITLNIATAGGINRSYQWQSSSTSGSDFSDIGSATNASYLVPTGSPGTIYYRVVINDSGTGCMSLTSTEAIITVTVNTLTITDNPANNTYVACQTIGTSGTVEVTETAMFKAGTSIILNTGFHAKANSNFLAMIEDCPSMLNEGIVQTAVVSNEATTAPKTNNLTQKERFDFNIAPNPFRNTTQFSFTLKTPTRLSIAVFDLNGKLVAHVRQHQLFEQGSHLIAFNMQTLQSGMFYVVVQGQASNYTGKMIRLQ